MTQGELQAEFLEKLAALMDEYKVSAFEIIENSRHWESYAFGMDIDMEHGYIEIENKYIYPDILREIATDFRKEEEVLTAYENPTKTKEIG